MGMDDFGWMSALFAGACLLAAFLGWREGNNRSDVALLGGSGVAFGTASALLFVL